MDELPSSLLAGAHGRRRLLLAGVSAAELRGPLWDEALPGRHAWTPTDPTHPRQRALVAASAVPLDGAVGGWAAAFLLGAHGLDGSTPDPDVFEPVLLCLPRVRQRPRWDGVRPFRSDLGPQDVVEVDGARVTSPVRTAFDLGRLAPSLIGSVVVLDAVARDLGIGKDAVARYARQRPRWRGLPRLRAALQLVDARSRSAQETRFRMLWVLGAGLDAPRSNWPVLDLRSPPRGGRPPGRQDRPGRRVRRRAPRRRRAAGRGQRSARGARAARPAGRPGHGHGPGPPAPVDGREAAVGSRPRTCP